MTGCVGWRALQTTVARAADARSKPPDHQLANVKLAEDVTPVRRVVSLLNADC
jgi:hypothetical protein